jgi:hypothetical protein
MKLLRRTPWNLDRLLTLSERERRYAMQSKPRALRHRIVGEIIERYRVADSDQRAELTSLARDILSYTVLCDINALYSSDFTYRTPRAWQAAVSRALDDLDPLLVAAARDADLNIDRVAPYLMRDRRRSIGNPELQREIVRRILDEEIGLDSVNADAAEEIGLEWLDQAAADMIADDLWALTKAKRRLLAADEHSTDELLAVLRDCAAGLHSGRHAHRGLGLKAVSRCQLSWDEVQTDWHDFHRYREEVESGVPMSLRHTYNPNGNLITQISDALDIDAITVANVVERAAFSSALT